MGWLCNMLHCMAQAHRRDGAFYSHSVGGSGRYALERLHFRGEVPVISFTSSTENNFTLPFRSQSSIFPASDAFLSLGLNRSFCYGHRVLVLHHATWATGAVTQSAIIGHSANLDIQYRRQQLDTNASLRPHSPITRFFYRLDR